MADPCVELRAALPDVVRVTVFTEGSCGAGDGTDGALTGIGALGSVETEGTGVLGTVGSLGAGAAGTAGTGAGGSLGGAGSFGAGGGGVTVTGTGGGGSFGGGGRGVGGIAGGAGKGVFTGTVRGGSAAAATFFTAGTEDVTDLIAPTELEDTEASAEGTEAAGTGAFFAAVDSVEVAALVIVCVLVCVLLVGGGAGAAGAVTGTGADFEAGVGTAGAVAGAGADFGGRPGTAGGLTGAGADGAGTEFETGADFASVSPAAAAGSAAASREQIMSQAKPRFLLPGEAPMLLRSITGHAYVQGSRYPLRHRFMRT